MLSATQRHQMEDPRLLDIGTLGSHGHHSGRTFKIAVNFSQLARLIDSAAVGWRIYELMSILRPGDLLNYLLVSPVEINRHIEQVIRKANMDEFEIRFHPDRPLPTLPFPEVDQCFRWRGDDTQDWDKTWCTVRDSELWQAMILELFPVVQQAQKYLANSPDPLTQRELRQIEQITHPEMMTARTHRRTNVSELPPGKEQLPKSLFAYLQTLIETEEIRSLSGQVGDYYFWRMLIETQLARAENSGLPPRQAFGLGSADCGVPWLSPKFLGADVHVPYEGVCGGDIFFMPDWFRFDAESAAAAGRLTAGTWDKHCRYLITQRDLGELPFARHHQFSDWHVYEDTVSAVPTNTFDTRRED